MLVCLLSNWGLMHTSNLYFTLLNNFSFLWSKFFYLFEFLVVITTLTSLKIFYLHAHLWGWIFFHYLRSPLPVWWFYGSLHLMPTFLEFTARLILATWVLIPCGHCKSSLNQLVTSQFSAVNLYMFSPSVLAPHIRISGRCFSVSLHRKRVPSSIPCKFEFPCYA